MRKFYFTSLLFSCSYACFSQDTHYWGSQYNPGGFFSPGAVIAWNGDSSVLFYNPALQARSGSAKISVNANAYYIESIKMPEGAGTGRPLKSTGSGSVPILVAGNFRLNPKVNIGYGLITSRVIDFNATQRRDEQFQVLGDSYSPGPEYFVGQFIGQNNIRLFKAIAGAGFALSPRLSAGIYAEGTSRNQKYQLNYIARALVNPPGNATIPLVSTDFNYYASYTHYGLRFKFGFAWDSPTDHIGVMLQTPMISMGGNGLLMSDEVISNGRILGVLISLIGNTRQDNLPVKWKEPVSIAFGYSKQIDPKMLINVTGEYFAGLKDYNILTPRPDFFLRPDTGGTNLFTPDILKLKDARRSVGNVSAAISYLLNEKVTLYFAIRTDLSYFDKQKFRDDRGFAPYVTNCNIYHTQAGFNLKRKVYNLRLGMYLGFGGNKSFEQPFSFDDPNENNFLQGSPGKTSQRYFTAGLTISYIHFF